MAFDGTSRGLDKGGGPHFSNYWNNTTMNTARASRNDIKTTANALSAKAPDENVMLQTSTNIFIYANGGIVGMIQNFTVNETRPVNKLQAIGYEGVIQAVPGNTNGGSLSISRIALYGSNLWASLGLTVDGHTYNPIGSKVHTGAPEVGWDKVTTDHDSGTKVAGKSGQLTFKTLKDQRVPLEIQVKTKAAGSTAEFFVETYVDCWLASYSKTIGVGTITVAESATVQYSDVY